MAVLYRGCSAETVAGGPLLAGASVLQGKGLLYAKSQRVNVSGTQTKRHPNPPNRPHGSPAPGIMQSCPSRAGPRWAPFSSTQQKEGARPPCLEMALPPLAAPSSPVLHRHSLPHPCSRPRGGVWTWVRTHRAAGFQELLWSRRGRCEPLVPRKLLFGRLQSPAPRKPNRNPSGLMVKGRQFLLLLLSPLKSS